MISAADDSVLNEEQRTHNAYSYNVWAETNGNHVPYKDPHGSAFLPHPTGMPDGSSPTTNQPRNLIALDHAQFSQNDPWLAAGATEAKGNSTWVFDDLVAPRGFNAGDQALTPSMPATFDYSIDPDGDPRDVAAQQAGLTQLFYTLNYLHDVFYDAGFDEKSGNAQQDNFGRGGLGGDPIVGLAQVYGARNNANATTPEDGASPQVQIFLWNGARATRITAPADLAGSYTSGAVSFGPVSYKVAADLVLVDDGTGVSSSDGCDVPFVNAAAVSGKLALIDRGGCGATIKTKNAQDAGAIGVVFASLTGVAANLSGTDATITIPSIVLGQTDSDAIKAKLTAGTAVTLAMNDRLIDGTLDSMLVVHEFTHVMGQRLHSVAKGTQARGLHEGWPDFAALLSFVRPDAANVASNSGWNGTFAVGGYSNTLNANAITMASSIAARPVRSASPCATPAARPRAAAR